MFTGLIERLGRVCRIEPRGANRLLIIKPIKVATGKSLPHDFVVAMKPGDSIAIDGICLTIVEKGTANFKVEAVSETVQNTTIKYYRIGDYVNLELPISPQDRFGGHFVQGHIDEVAKITRIQQKPGCQSFEFLISNKSIPYLVEKGSIAIDGVSLTIAQVSGSRFTVNIIPFTLTNTNFKYKRVGDWVNIEYDIIGKYVIKNLGNSSKWLKC